MLTLIFFAIIFVTAVFYIRINKLPKQIENIPTISILPYIWAILQQKYQDEIQEYLRGPDIYLVCILSIYCEIIMHTM